ncbi:Uncharacterised protein [Mycobacteroides abscessus subsp. abscessus]|nr:Uncharacterised protein [Mycobacteroides abscessus subsp. abscessus]
MPRVAFQPRVDRLRDGGVAGQVLGHRLRVLAVSLHAQRQGLDTPVGQVAVERARHRTRPVLQEREGGVQLLVVGEQGSPNDIGMSANVFGGGVQRDIGAEIQRLL